MPPRAAKFAIGGELQSDIFLLLDDFFDLAVFHRFERRDVDLAFGALGPCLLQRRGTQEASNMVGAKGRRGALGHDGYSLLRTCPRESGDSIHVRWIFARGNKRRCYFPHTSSANSTIMRSFAHCSSSARTLPSSVEAKPHCGERQSCSSATYFVASSIRFLISARGSRRPDLDVTRPSTTILLLFGRKRSGSNP